MLGKTDPKTSLVVTLQRAAVAHAQQCLIEKEEEVKGLIQEKETLVRDYKKRLEAMFRGVVRDLDEMKAQKIIAENKLGESKV